MNFSAEDGQLKEEILINLIPSPKMLDELVVSGKVMAINFKGDTIEYVADSFLLDKNADIERPLKPLPGFEMSREGVITVYGERIEKLMIDGDEYLSNNQMLVTQSLRADIVDRVQVFDKKSDYAEFAGVDDSKTVKAMNLKLKNDRKNRYFGKITASKASERESALSTTDDLRLNSQNRLLTSGGGKGVSSI